jgi:hypothetical protein
LRPRLCASRRHPRSDVSWAVWTRPAAGYTTDNVLSDRRHLDEESFAKNARRKHGICVYSRFLALRTGAGQRRPARWRRWWFAWRCRAAIHGLWRRCTQTVCFPRTFASLRGSAPQCRAARRCWSAFDVERKPKARDQACHGQSSVHRRYGAPQRPATEHASQYREHSSHATEHSTIDARCKTVNPSVHSARHAVDSSRHAVDSAEHWQHRRESSWNRRHPTQHAPWRRWLSRKTTWSRKQGSAEPR